MTLFVCADPKEVIVTYRVIGLLVTARIKIFVPDVTFATVGVEIVDDVGVTPSADPLIPKTVLEFPAPPAISWPVNTAIHFGGIGTNVEAIVFVEAVPALSPQEFVEVTIGTGGGTTSSCARLVNCAP